MLSFLRRLFGKKSSKQKQNQFEDEISALFRAYLELEQMHLELCTVYQATERKILWQKQQVRQQVHIMTMAEFKPTIYQNCYVRDSSMAYIDENSWITL